MNHFRRWLEDLKNGWFINCYLLWRDLAAITAFIFFLVFVTVNNSLRELWRNCLKWWKSRLVHSFWVFVLIKNLNYGWFLLFSWVGIEFGLFAFGCGMLWGSNTADFICLISFKLVLHLLVDTHLSFRCWIILDFVVCRHLNSV